MDRQVQNINRAIDNDIINRALGAIGDATSIGNVPDNPPTTATEVLARQQELYGRSPVMLTLESLEEARRIMSENTNITADDLMSRYINPPIVMDEALRPVNRRWFNTRPDIQNGRLGNFEGMNFFAERNVTPQNIVDEISAFKNMYLNIDAPDGLIEANLFCILRLINPEIEFRVTNSPIHYEYQIHFTADYAGETENRRIEMGMAMRPRDHYRDVAGVNATAIVRHEYQPEAEATMRGMFADTIRDRIITKYNAHMAAKKPRKKTPRIRFLVAAFEEYVENYYIRAQQAQYELRYARQMRDQYNQIHDAADAAHMGAQAAAMAAGLAGGIAQTPMKRYEEKPHEPEAATWLESCNVPKELEAKIAHLDFKATLLDDSLKIWKESKDMGNCLYRSYTSKIMGTNYIAYHIKANHLSKSGFTLGFYKCRRISGREIQPWETVPEKKVNEIEISWGFDQLRGKHNDIDKDENLKMFADHILQEVKAAYVQQSE